MSNSFIKQFIDDESGQGITEYGAILAFVAVLIAMAFSQQSKLNTALNAAFSKVVTQLNAIGTP